MQRESRTELKLRIKVSGQHCDRQVPPTVTRAEKEKGNKYSSSQPSDKLYTKDHIMSSNNNNNESPNTIPTVDSTSEDLLKFDEEEEDQQVKVAQDSSSCSSSPEPTPRNLQLIPLQLPRLTANYSSNSLVEIPLHESSDEEFNDIEDGGVGRDLEDDEVDAAEHADHLSPLMMDNHTVVEHLECYSTGGPQPTPPVMVVDSEGNITIMKHSDTKDSLSSLDSDLGMSGYQRQNDSSSFSSSSDDPARDSGCETGPCAPSRPYCPVEADECAVTNSGGDEEDDDRPFEKPNEEFSERIVEQVEFYFSNESILKDAFLLKHVRRNKEGFVSLKLVSSFKRVRQLTKDWRVVGHAIQLKSKTVELNDVGTKVRRIDALPNYDETMPSRTVVATDLNVDKITIEKAYELFSKCGEIALVRILRVGGPIPADVRQFINKYPELLQKECALVEFVESRSARNALACEGITVLEMVAPKKKTGKKQNATVTRIVESSQVSAPPSMMHSFNSHHHGGRDEERSRGGAPLMENNTPPRFQIRRATPGYYSKPDQVIYVPPPRKFGYSHGSAAAASGVHQFQANNNNNNSGVVAATAPPPPPPAVPGFVHHHNHHNSHHHYGGVGSNPYQYQPQPPPPPPPVQSHHHHHHQPQHLMANNQQHYHHHNHAPQSPPSPSDTYEVYRRTSSGQIVAVTSSPTNKFNSDRRAFVEPPTATEIRRNSQNDQLMSPRKIHAQQPLAVPSPQPVYECQCNCQHQQQTQHHQPLRRLSSNDLMFRRVSITSQQSGGESPRKLSFERKVSTTETNWRNEAPVTVERKYSNNGDNQQALQFQSESPMRKFSTNSGDEYVNGRRISTDSGYDRKYSFSSECSNARSRSNSFICNHAPVVEQVLRTPTGPVDGSRGFGLRTRKIGQILPPI